MQDKLVQWLIRAAASLPLGTAQGAGRWLGRLIYWTPNNLRRVARINIERCFPHWTPRQRAALLRQTLMENACTLLEMPGIWLKDEARILECIVEGDARTLLQEKLALGKGLILVAPHLGNWETGIHFLADVGPITALYRPPRMQALEAMITAGRSSGGARLVPTKVKGVKALFAALRQGEMITILPDQQPKTGDGGAGVFAPFFGAPALTMTLLSRLVKKSGAAVLFIYMERLPHAQGFKVNLVEPPAGMDAEDEAAAVAALNRGVEACVLAKPAQYQWTYKRFSIQPEGYPSPYRT